MSDLYKIKPLKWEFEFCSWRQAYKACVPMGTYEVVRFRKDCDEGNPWGEWCFEWCFAEYYDDGSRECGNSKAGKEMAWQDWQKRIAPALIKA